MCGLPAPEGQILPSFILLQSTFEKKSIRGASIDIQIQNFPGKICKYIGNQKVTTFLQLFISRYQCKRSIFLFTNKVLNIKVVSIIFKNIFQNLMIIMYFIFSAYMRCIELQSSQYIFLSLGQVENLFLYICLCFKTTLQQVLSVKSGLVLGTASGG